MPERILRLAVAFLFLAVMNGTAQRKNLVLQPGAAFSGTGTTIVKDSIQNPGGGVGMMTIPGRIILNGTNQWIGSIGGEGLRTDTLTVNGSGTKTFQVTMTVAESLTVSTGTTAKFNGDTLRIGKLSGNAGSIVSNAATVIEYTRADGVVQTLMPGTFTGKLRLFGASRKTVGAALTTDSLEHTGGLAVNGPLTVNGRAQVDTLLDIAPGASLQFGTAASTMTLLAANHGTVTGGAGSLTISGPSANAGSILGGPGRFTFGNPLTHTAGLVAAGTGGMVFGNSVTASGTAIIRSTAVAESLAFNGPVTFVSGTSSLTLTGTGVASFLQSPSLAGPANMSLAGTSTVYYAGGAMSLPAASYGTLGLTSAGLKTFASGTTGVAGSILVLNSATADAVTNGGTIDYNGTGAQTVAAMRYANLSISGNRGAESVTLAPDTSRIIAAFTYSATNVTIVNAGSAIEYAGSVPQTITPFPYFNLLLSGTGAKSLLASQTTNGDVTLQAGASLTVDVLAAWQIDGSLYPIGTFINNGSITIGN